MSEARSGPWRRRLWCAVPLLASLGVVTGVAGTALPEDAIAQERGDDSGLLPGVGELLPPPPGLSGSSSEPTTSAPGSSQPDPPTSSEQRRPSLPLLPPPSGDKPGLLPPPSGDKPGLLPPPPPAPQLSLHHGLSWLRTPDDNDRWSAI